MYKIICCVHDFPSVSVPELCDNRCVVCYMPVFVHLLSPISLPLFIEKEFAIFQEYTVQ